jgi:hypothetical protein
VRDVAQSFAGLVFDQLSHSLVTGADCAYLLPDVRVMYTVSSGKDLIGERQQAAC